ncbi:MAG: tetratricopeptide repeat protein [Calditrichaceae bacterium]|nr:tetratricopeptide repeat protein [Calditrichaceae bacterium]MBN2708831.1 tetratricopeptide repeat protein [Calditrichaceae bacterium]RQV97710.1 MAG: tetratricopeptide repeat protein [Calditrichota bacterium]
MGISVICKKCGAENDDNARYCSQCGSKLPVRGKQRINAKNSVKTKFVINSQLIVVIAFIIALIIVLLILQDNRNILESRLIGAGAQTDHEHQASISPGAMEEIQRLKNKLSENEHDVETLISLGNSYFDLGRYDEAVGYYNHALEHDIQNANVLIDMGVAYYNLGQSDQAVLLMEKALEIEPGHQQGLYNLGIVNYNDKKNEKAVFYWNKLIELYPDSRETQNARNLIKQIRNEQ